MMEILVVEKKSVKMKRGVKGKRCIVIAYFAERMGCNVI
jgi:hypothetical protein